MPKSKFRGLYLPLLCCLFAAGAGCSKSGTPSQESTKTPYTSKGDEGSIKGIVTLAGAPGGAAAPKPIDMSGEAACAQSNPNAITESVVAKDGKLANVLIFIRDGNTSDNRNITSLSFPVPTDSVTLDQKGCQYSPHVIALQAGQNLKVTNSDPADHNVHARPDTSNGNEEWSQSQPPNAPPIVKVFRNSEVVVPVKCDQHNWMKAYIGVLANPFYAVSGPDGSFEIKNVPPGNYTLEAWQETYKVKSQQITVGPKGVATANFSYDAGANAKINENGSLNEMPAMTFPIRH